jgi:EamA domain-containing membrane protein RarD
MLSLRLPLGGTVHFLQGVVLMGNYLTISDMLAFAMVIIGIAALLKDSGK